MENRTANEVEKLLEEAYEYEAGQDLVAALDKCSQAIQLNPNAAEVYNLQGLVLEQLGRQSEAMKAYQLAVFHEPDNEDAQQNLAELQSEFQEEIHYAHKVKELRFAVLWGMLAFSLSYATVAILRAMIYFLPIGADGPSLLFELQIFLINVVPFIIITSIAMAIIGNQNYGRGLLFGLTTLITGSLTLSAVRFFALLIGPLWGFLPYGSNYLAIELAIAGAVVGAALGIILKDKYLALLLSLVCAIGFGIYYFTPPPFAQFLGTHYLNLQVYIFERTQDQTAMLALTEAIIGGGRNLIAGSIAGGLIGWIAGWHSASFDQETYE